MGLTMRWEDDASQYLSPGYMYRRMPKRTYYDDEYDMPIFKRKGEIKPDNSPVKFKDIQSKQNDVKIRQVEVKSIYCVPLGTVIDKSGKEMPGIPPFTNEMRCHFYY